MAPSPPALEDVGEQLAQVHLNPVPAGPRMPGAPTGRRRSSSSSTSSSSSNDLSSSSQQQQQHHAFLKAFNPTEVQVEVESELAAVGDRVLLRTVSVHNMSNEDLGPSLTLTAEENDLCFLERVVVGALAKGQSKVVHLRLRVRGDLSIPYEDAIPDRYILTLSHASPSSSTAPPVKIRYAFPHSFRSFLRGLPGLAPRRVVTLPPSSPQQQESQQQQQQQQQQQRRLVAPANLVLIGPAGAGKSTLLGHMLTLVSDRDRVNLGGVRTCSTSSHGTLELRAYPLPTVSSVSVWDTRGMTASNYSREELAFILDGVYPEKGWDPLERDASRHAEVLAAGASTRAIRRQQACIVVVPEGLLQSTVELDQLRTQLVHVQRAGLNPLVVLTHVDLAYPSLRNDPSGGNLSELGEAKREAARQLGVEVNRVLHFVPYKDEEVRRFAIDRLTYKVLSKALQLAAEYEESSSLPLSSSSSSFAEENLTGSNAPTILPAAAAVAATPPTNPPPPVFDASYSSPTPSPSLPPPSLRQQQYVPGPPSTVQGAGGGRRRVVGGRGENERGDASVAETVVLGAEESDDEEEEGEEEEEVDDGVSSIHDSIYSEAGTLPIH